MSSTSFLNVHWPLSLDRRYVWCCGDLNLHCILNGASPLFCGGYCPVRGRVCSLVVRIGGPRSVSELGCWFQCEVGRVGALALREVTGFSSSWAVHLWVYSAVSLFTHCAHKLHRHWNCSQPHLNREYAGSWPWCLSGIVSTRPPVQIHWSQVPGLQQSCTWTRCGSYEGSSDSGLVQSLCVLAHKAHIC